MSVRTYPVNEARLVQTFLDLARQNTPPRCERDAAEVARRLLESLGFECEYDDAGEKVGGNVGNLIAWKPGTVSSAIPIFFSAHFDTVEPTPGLEPIIEGDIIRSDGKTLVGADDKCGLAPILEAMQILDEQKIPHGGIQLLLTICEEIGLVGARHLDPNRIRARYGFVLDAGPPVGSMVYHAPSQDIFDVVIHGRPAHAGAEPENGVSAILIAARAIARMKLGRIDHETTANVGIIHGGVATNIIPATVTLKCEARSRRQPKMEKQRDAMIAAFREEADLLGGTVDVDCYNAYPGYELPMESPALLIGQTAAERLGIEPLLRVTGGGADANYFNAYGVPTTVLGCGMRNIHRHDEYLLISDMVASTRMVLSIVEVAAEWPEGTEGC
ncbi:MAG: M20/M25/M40 family metallo-hydrolase [Capsulimonadaceae bacterium]